MPLPTSHLTYYDYQAQARGIRNAEDVFRDAAAKAFIYNRLVLPNLPIDRSARLVELACGHGAFLVWAKGQGYNNLLGVDSSPPQIEAARRADVSAELADVSTWLSVQPARSTAVIVAIDLIEHLPKDDFMTLLGQAARVLMPGGCLILRHPNADSPLVGLNLFNDITHVWAYTSNCLRTLARMHGFLDGAFTDEGWRVARDHRWFKLPLGWLAEAFLKNLFRAAAREQLMGWSPHGWSFFKRSKEDPI